MSRKRWGELLVVFMLAAFLGFAFRLMGYQSRQDHNLDSYQQLAQPTTWARPPLKSDPMMNKSNEAGVDDQEKNSKVKGYIRTDTNEKDVTIIDKAAKKRTRKIELPKTLSNSSLTFFIVPIPELTEELLEYKPYARGYYQGALNEESAEVWMYRGLQNSSKRVLDPSLAEVHVIPALLHLHQKKHKDENGKQVASLVISKIVDKSKPHVWLTPTWNPGTARSIGNHQTLTALVRELGESKVFSIGFERNPKWQSAVSLSRIVPIPYVIRPTRTYEELQGDLTKPRNENFVFYAGDGRRNAVSWAGCNRTQLTMGLTNSSNADVRIVTKKNRISQELYNRRMLESDYCLILCGDTPTSRSLTSAMVSGCVPIRVGSRLRGLCEPPCHEGFGWTITGDPALGHLPFESDLSWNEFPEVDEAKYIADSEGNLRELFKRYDKLRKQKLREVMQSTQMKWIYGWGDPVTSIKFGGAVDAIWESVSRVVIEHRESQS